MEQKLIIWEKINNCEHEWTDYFDGGVCATPYCSWSETHCKICGIYKMKCGCGFMNGLSGEPYKKVINRKRKKLYKKLYTIHLNLIK